MEANSDGQADLDMDSPHNTDTDNTKDSGKANNSTPVDTHTERGSLNEGFNIEIDPNETSHTKAPDVHESEVEKQAYPLTLAEILKSGPKPNKHNLNRGISGMTKKHAFVCKPLPDTALSLYVEATACVLNPDQIIAASRMNRNIVIFLDCVESVEIVCTHGLGINGEMIFPEPMVKTSTKVIISNIPPHLPNDVIYPILQPLGNIVSGIRPISLGIKNPKLKHVISFRRQVYILIKPGVLDDNQLKFNIEHDSHNFTVFVSKADVRCFKCGSLSHLQSACVPDSEKTPEKQITKTRTTQQNETHIEEGSSLSGDLPMHLRQSDSKSKNDANDFKTVSYRRTRKKVSPKTDGVRVRTPSPSTSSSRRSRSSDRPPDDIDKTHQPATDEGVNQTTEKHPCSVNEHEDNTDMESSEVDNSMDTEDNTSTVSHMSCLSNLSDFDPETNESWSSEFDKGLEILEATKSKKNQVQIALDIEPDPRTLVKCLKALRKYDLTSAQKQQLGRLLVKVLKHAKTFGHI